MSVAVALTRTLLLAANVGCAAAPVPAIVLRDSERVAGRASLHGQTVLLTTAPALVTVAGGSLTGSRYLFEGRDRSVTTLWGLGERRGALYSISQFSDLVRLAPGNATVRLDHVARIPHPIGNIVDTHDGMAAQLAVDDEGKPIVWAIDPAGALSAMESPARASLGLSRAEEGLLHLLTCSVPPRVVCWLPGSGRLLALEGTGLTPLATIGPARRVAPAALLERPQERSITDAIWTGSDVVAVAFTADSGRSTVAEFTTGGRMIRELTPPAAVRLFVSAHERRIVAISRTGSLIEVPR